MALDAGQLGAECRGQGAGQDRLAHPGDVLDQEVAARQGGDHGGGDGDGRAQEDAGQCGVELAGQDHGVVERTRVGGVRFRQESRHGAGGRHRPREVGPVPCLDAGGHGVS